MHIRFDGGDQSEIVERCRSQLRRNPLHRRDRLRERLADAAGHHLLIGIQRLGTDEQTTDVHFQRREELSELVVNLARDAAAFLFLNVEQFLRQRLQRGFHLGAALDHVIERLRHDCDLAWTVGRNLSHVTGIGDPFRGAREDVQRTLDRPRETQSQQQHDRKDDHPRREAAHDQRSHCGASDAGRNAHVDQPIAPRHVREAILARDAIDAASLRPSLPSSRRDAAGSGGAVIAAEPALAIGGPSGDTPICINQRDNSSGRKSADVEIEILLQRKDAGNCVAIPDRTKIDRDPLAGNRQHDCLETRVRRAAQSRTDERLGGRADLRVGFCRGGGADDVSARVEENEVQVLREEVDDREKGIAIAGSRMANLRTSDHSRQKRVRPRVRITQIARQRSGDPEREILR